MYPAHPQDKEKQEEKHSLFFRLIPVAINLTAAPCWTPLLSSLHLVHLSLLHRDLILLLLLPL